MKNLIELVRELAIIVRRNAVGSEAEVDPIIEELESLINDIEK